MGVSGTTCEKCRACDGAGIIWESVKTVPVTPQPMKLELDPGGERFDSSIGPGGFRMAAWLNQDGSIGISLPPSGDLTPTQYQEFVSWAKRIKVRW